MKKTKIKDNNNMPNQLKIEELFVVDGKTFYSREDAQEYIDDIQKERSKNDYHDTVYYENWTTAGEDAKLVMQDGKHIKKPLMRCLTMLILGVHMVQDGLTKLQSQKIKTNVFELKLKKFMRICKGKKL